jgi:tetratricopeptide (TPR) repeat protein
VISHNSAVILKGTKKPTREIGELLKVGHILGGSVRKAGNNLRISAQLTDAVTDEHIWAERYAGTLDDIFDIQEKVAFTIADALRVKLTPGEQQDLKQRPVSDPRVLECYHRARTELLFFTVESCERAKRILLQGIDVLGGHAVLYFGLALIHFIAYEGFIETRDDAIKSAMEYTRRVQDLDPQYASLILAKLERCTGSQVKAMRYFEDGLILNPGDVDALFYLSHSYGFHAGKPAAGLALAEKLIRIDPLTVANLISVGTCHCANGDLVRAAAVFDEIRRREPALRVMSSLFQMNVLARMGRTDDAYRLAEETVAENNDGMFARMMTLFKYALLGERDSFLDAITGELRMYAWNDPECPEWFAGWFAMVNERDQALEWLEHWVDRGSINYPMLAHGDPLLEPLRGELRFQRLLDRIRPEWERFVPRLQIEG